MRDYLSMDKPRPSKDEDFYIEWAQWHTFCQCCGICYSTARFERFPGLSTHHLIKSGRAHEPAVLLRLCQRCHDLAEGRPVRHEGELLPTLPLGVCLTVKKTREPEAYDPVRLEELRGFPLPDLRPIPPVFEKEYRRRRPRDRRRFFTGSNI